MTRIAGAGVHVPRLRLAAAAVEAAWGSGPGIDRRAVPAADEDALTMAVAATRRALADAGVDAGRVGTVALATTAPPLAEGEVLPRLARMLGLPDGVRTRTFAQSPAGAADAVLAAADADGPAVAVAADCPRGDAPEDGGFGAGAAALVFAEDGPVALTGRAEHARDAPGVRLRERGDEAVSSPDVTGYERSVLRETTAAAVEGLDADAGAFAAAALHQPTPRTAARAAADSGLDADAVDAGTVVDRLGDAGAATVPLGLLAGLSTADVGDRVLAVPFGGGSRATALAFRVDAAVEAGVDAALEGGREVSYDRYLRERGHLGDAAVEGGGAHVSLPSWQRTLDGRYLRSAGRCPECGAVAFPPEGACPSCHERVAFESVPLPDEGVVEAVTTVGAGSAPPEFATLQRRSGAFATALVSLSVGSASVRLPAMCTDCDPSAVAVGDRVRAAIRRLYADEGVVRYAAKFVPVG